VHAFEPLALLGEVEPPIDFSALKRDVEEQLAGPWSAASREAGVDHEVRCVEHKPVAALVDVSREVGAELIVVATRGRGGFRGLLLGSVALGLPQVAPCAVVILPPEDR
jgi:nucleotide-binding universal stress UspA family protein